MGWFQRLPRQKAGKPVVARTINQIADAAEMSARIRVSPPLSLSVGPMGPILRLLGPVFGAYIVKTDGTINGRSGTSPGDGNVKIQTWNGTVLANLPGADDLVILNWNSTSIDTGKYGVVLKIAGAYWAIAFEC